MSGGSGGKGRSAEEIVDLARLNAWPGLAEVPGSGPVEGIEALRGGAQNLLFVIRRADGTEVVLRRPGRFTAGDEAAKPFLRESRVLTALSGTDVPHPRLYASTTDTSIIDAPFAIMERIDGFTPRGQLPGGYATDPQWRRTLALELVGGAAKLASVDADKIGLGDLSRTENWLERQVSRYLTNLHGYRENAEYREAESPAVDAVATWLDANRPSGFTPGLVHGDLQFANVMFDREAPRLAAIVDWEMTGLGDPLVDLAWILTAWREPGDPPGSDPQLQPWDGFPGRAELVAHWADLTGRDVSDFPWFQVLACFRLAALLEGSFVRALNGRMDRAMGDALHQYAGWIWTFARQKIAEA